MTPHSSPSDPLLQHIFDAFPAMVFVVDRHTRVQAFNEAAKNLLSAEEDAVLQKPGGEVLGCFNADADGCGHGLACAQCVVRNAVGAVFKGRRTVRQRTRLDLKKNGETVDFFVQVTASPLVYEGRELALLVIEDFSEIAELKRMIRICSVCKKVCDEASSWSQLETYFKDRWGVDFSHGYCPECYQEACNQIRAELSNSDVARP
jgi:nitrogen fixation/metabolism regulation signal transduction histidine kinase